MIVWRGDELLREVDRVTATALQKAANIVQREVKTSLGTQGRLGKRTKALFISTRSKTQTSGVGDPPFWQTKTLRKSIATEVGRGGLFDLEARVGTNVPYALHLELGTIHMGPRPYLRPALARMGPRIARIFRGLIK